MIRVVFQVIDQKTGKFHTVSVIADDYDVQPFEADGPRSILDVNISQLERVEVYHDAPPRWNHFKWERGGDGKWTGGEQSRSLP